MSLFIERILSEPLDRGTDNACVDTLTDNSAEFPG